MSSSKFIGKIRNYSIISFLLPLIAINGCLFVYKLLGDMERYSALNWNEKEYEYSFDNYFDIGTNFKARTFTNCPKYKYQLFYTTIDNEVLSEKDVLLREKKHGSDYLNILIQQNKIKSVKILSGEIINERCIKNSKFLYFLLRNFNFLEKILITGQENNQSGFSKIKNPYLYGEVSISRTARYFPSTLIFKPLIILSAIFLLLYWKNNLNLFTELKNKNILNNFSKNFFYLGVLSCIFLILHALLLGMEFDSKVFHKIRRLIIILFIFFEIFAQILLTKNLFKFKERIKNYIYPLIIKIKIIFVTTIFFITSLLSILLIWGDLDTSFKHTLEWNYFSFLLVYYILSRLLWRKPLKNQKL